ncbi:MAG: sigma-70 family RNA polymerase sigma factor, partial [Bacteroidales bacterium]|nr:sigma-70 family RNA polymerase sigma factor [Bacteroidales bacterium]
PVGYRTVLNLFVFEKHTHKEISIALNISESTSKSQLSKARSLLRKKMKEFCKVQEVKK